ncbi:TIGR04283 family arsenosugar biosynthesis glycosyltransferase [Oceanimonas sp. CHS3-5]|uniref:TIGR04283 family arsenosugar biosynthesis glycosyltransferase n=1 Tax=Oceanimonas sp. CHS3-5 TaxID=3068186 RepID=UPI00273DC8F4|nr:TIGR04283 family arsenosugar biosynthesis glycosyltransferase [Oceanimonas sp. CHS3-5]MDP5291735.1 TIGR04283 family arsenosugar biosynthesis glycosyltransferase [Oceanimonas sp. CHS3-5]
MSLSIIIPALNEATTLPATLKALPPHAEVIVVDGGSTDDTPRLAQRLGARVIPSRPGRARQMNAGAAAARGQCLLFLHADTLLPDRAAELVTTALQRHHWGRFDVILQGRQPMLAVIGRLMNLRSRLSGIATGDQGLFMRKSTFSAVGGFPEQPLMEDIELSKRLKKQGPPACLRQRVRTSGRRWEQNGLWRTIWLMWRLRFAYWRGADPEQLAAQYR